MHDLREDGSTGAAVEELSLTEPKISENNETGPRLSFDLQGQELAP